MCLHSKIYCTDIQPGGKTTPSDIVQMVRLLAMVYLKLNQNINMHTIQPTDRPVSGLLAFISVSQDCQVEVLASKSLDEQTSFNKNTFTLYV